MGLTWMYLLVLVPVVTDVIETGGWPARPREWFTEVSVGLLIAVLVRRILRERRALEALARVDALTGLGNRRAFEEALAEECARALRLPHPLHERGRGDTTAWQRNLAGLASSEAASA